MIATVVLAAGLFYALWQCNRLIRRNADLAARLAETRAAACQAIDQLAEKNLELHHANRLMQLQSRAQADIERIFLGFVRQVSPETADALAREFASVNAFLGLDRALAPHRVRQPARRKSGEGT